MIVLSGSLEEMATSSKMTSMLKVAQTWEPVSGMAVKRATLLSRRTQAIFSREERAAVSSGEVVSRRGAQDGVGASLRWDECDGGVAALSCRLGGCLLWKVPMFLSWALNLILAVGEANASPELIGLEGRLE